MSDGGFDFRPPPPRREARRFEPPPWERDQFEKLARERAEQEKAELDAALAAAEIAAAARPAQEADPASGPTPEEVQSGSPQAGVERAAEGEIDRGPVAAAEAKAAAVLEVPKVELDDKQVALMMLDLRAEEPVSLQAAWAVNLGAGGIVGLVGLVIGVWGIVALANRNLGTTGTLGGMVLVAFGVGFVAIGGWLIYKALRQRGVL